MTASLTARIEPLEPLMVRAPGGWFWMGCEIGRDDEKPAHRVWVDAFWLAACQLTNEEYGRFLSATRYPQPFCRNHPGVPDVRVMSERLSGAEAQSRNREILMAYPAATVRIEKADESRQER